MGSNSKAKLMFGVSLSQRQARLFDAVFGNAAAEAGLSGARALREALGAPGLQMRGYDAWPGGYEDVEWFDDSDGLQEYLVGFLIEEGAARTLSSRARGEPPKELAELWSAKIAPIMESIPIDMDPELHSVSAED